jgi:polyphosphate glucokinase
MTRGSIRGSATGAGPHTLAIDIGGTGLKASVLDRDGKMAADRVRVATPHACAPAVMLRTLKKLTAPLPSFDRVSVGFPGVVRAGYVLTAPHFGNGIWHGLPLAAALEKLFRKPVRLLNDAEVQGLGIITGQGLEVVLTLGTGVGSAIFDHGRLAPHLELAHHPLHNDKTYDDYLGNAAFRRHGTKKWSERVLKTIAIIDVLLNYDRLYLGGGNAKRLEGKLPEHVNICSNDAGLTGGIALWSEAMGEIFAVSRKPVRSRAI